MASVKDTVDCSVSVGEAPANHDLTNKTDKESLLVLERPVHMTPPMSSLDPLPGIKMLNDLLKRIKKDDSCQRSAAGSNEKTSQQTKPDGQMSVTTTGSRCPQQTDQLFRKNTLLSDNHTSVVPSIGNTDQE